MHVNPRAALISSCRPVFSGPPLLPKCAKLIINTILYRDFILDGLTPAKARRRREISRAYYGLLKQASILLLTACNVLR